MTNHPKKESSFEILPNSDDDDITASMYSSMQSSAFESLNSSYFLESIMEGANNDNKLKMNCSTNEKQNFCGKLCSKKLSLDSLIEPFVKSNDNPDQVLNSKNISIPSWVNGSDSVATYFMKSSCDKEVERKACFSEIAEEANRDQQNGKLENYFRTKVTNDVPFSTENSVSNIDFSTHAIQNPWNSDSNIVNEQPVIKSTTLYAIERFENPAAQLPPDRNCVRTDCCSLIKYGLRLCRGFWNNRYLRNLISNVQTSFYNALNMCELEMNLMMGMKDPLKIIITAEASDSLVIEEAFYQSLSGQIVISKYPDMKDSSIPALPIGYNTALIVAQSKINKTRLLHTSEKEVIISTANFIAEVYPQRWQLCTLLYLEDPNLDLNLHNFTTTIPVPNDYILQAQSQTPDFYPLKDMGLAVTLEQVMGCTMDNMDLEEILCGVNHLVNLKSAAKKIAGMYNKYISRYVQ